MRTKGDGYVLAATVYYLFEDVVTLPVYERLLREGKVKWIKSGTEFDLNSSEENYVEGFDGCEFIWFRKEDIELEEGENYEN